MKDIIQLTALVVIIIVLGIFTYQVELKEDTIIKQHTRLIQPSEYVITIRNEHDVFLSNGIDTIQLLLENAYCLSDERIIFAKIKNYPKQ